MQQHVRQGARFKTQQIICVFDGGTGAHPPSLSRQLVSCASGSESHGSHGWKIPPSRPHCELICLQGGNILPAGEVHEGALWRRCQGPQEGLLLPALALQFLLQIQVSSKAQQPSGLRLALALSDPGSSPGSVHPCISASTGTFCRMQLIWKAHQPSPCCEPSLVPGHCEQLPVILRISGRCRPACVKGIDIL